MKNFLPQSSSDFIYAIIIEEFGLIGGFGIIILYLLLLFRIVVIAHKSKNFFGKLLVIGLGIPIVIQAFVNMVVDLQILPVTGKTVLIPVYITLFFLIFVMSCTQLFLRDNGPGKITLF